MDQHHDSEDEYKPDEDFINEDDIIVRHNHPEKVLKGYRIEQIRESGSLQNGPEANK